MKKTILITAPKGYADRFAEALSGGLDTNGRCFDPVSLPLIETDINTALNNTADNRPMMKDEDVVVFTSRKAIEAVALSCHRGELSLPSAATYVAVGKDVELMQALLERKQGFPVCEPSLMGIVEALCRIPRADRKRVVVFGPRVAGMREPATVPDFLSALSHLVGRVCFCPVYTTRAASGAIREALLSRIRQGVDCVAMTSGGEAQVLSETLASAPDGLGLLAATQLACFGPFTAKCAKSEGLPVGIVSDRYHSFRDFAEYLRDHLAWV